MEWNRGKSGRSGRMTTENKTVVKNCGHELWLRKVFKKKPRVTEMCRNVDSASVATRSSVGDPVKVFILESPVIFRRFATGVEEFRFDGESALAELE